MAGDQAQVVFHTTAPIDDPTNQAAIARLDVQIEGLPHVVGVKGPLGPSGTHQVASDGHIAYARVQFDEQAGTLPERRGPPRDRHRPTFAGPGLRRRAGRRTDRQRGHGPAPGSSEGIGILAAIMILLVAFGSVLAMGLPILTALFGIGIGIGLVDLLSHVDDRPDVRARSWRR